VLFGRIVRAARCRRRILLNVVEGPFAKLTRRSLKRGVFRSVTNPRPLLRRLPGIEFGIAKDRQPQSYARVIRASAIRPAAETMIVRSRRTSDIATAAVTGRPKAEKTML